MAVPGFNSFLLPLLTLLKDGNVHSRKESIAHLAQQFGLSEEDLSQMVPSQNESLVSNRTTWAATYLKKAGLVESAGRGLFKITDEGIKVLKSNPEKIDDAFLKRYPSFVEFQTIRKGDASSEVAHIENNDNNISSPEEIIDEKYNIVRKALAQELIEKVVAQTPAFFERLVVELLVKMGYGGSIEEAGKAVGKSGDEGIDGIIKEDRLGLDIIYIQAKRWQKDNLVSRPELHKFVGALAGQGAKKGVFITTSSFTKDARAYTPRNETKIVLIDGEQLSQLMIDYNIGVSSLKNYEIKKMDSDYFED